MGEQWSYLQQFRLKYLKQVGVEKIDDSFFSARFVFYVEAERLVGRYVFHESVKHVPVFKICISGI